MHARCAISAARVPMNRVDLRREPMSFRGSIRQAATAPRIQPALGDLEQPAHGGHRIVGLIHAHESEDRFGFGAVSCANQAAAFERISRSSLSCRFSRRRKRANSCRSALVNPPSPRPASRLLAPPSAQSTSSSRQTHAPVRCRRMTARRRAACAASRERESSANRVARSSA